jgi:hypothetical protein
MGFDLENAKGAPLMAAVIIMIAIIALGGMSFAFQGSIQF